ncbi:uncharacterized protein ARMOST_14390 [Armillaria ostoyae]|uniref:Uncharacterized protein n=1 Tax=Armillaria ostoyae TaxID=47428 RepID=A0A284RQE5_ARMOS|nr:uncharacterized protein ARMOST_14390 [Armillaria ostoyae]
MTGQFHTQQDIYDDVIHETGFALSGTLHSIPSNAIVVRDQVSFYQDRYEASGTGRTMFQLLRNNHEVIIWGPPLNERDGLFKELELIELLLNSADFDDIRQATLYIAWDGRARLIPQEQRFLQIPYLAGYPCVDESQLQVTEWLQAGWKRALLDGVRPVEVEYAYNLTSSLALQCMIDGCRHLEPLDLTTPVLACLVRDGHMIGLVKRIEEGARMVSYKDRTLVYTAFLKLQQRHIYLLDEADLGVPGFQQLPYDALGSSAVHGDFYVVGKASWAVQDRKDDGLEEPADHAWGDCAVHGKVEAAVGIFRYPVVEQVHRDRRLPPPTDVGGERRRPIHRDTGDIEKGAEREARARKHVGGFE